jgi:hypothetical protein
MNMRDQHTPPFNSPYQQAMKPSITLLQPSYPSPARSDSEPSKYPTDGLGLYTYPQTFSHDHSNTFTYPPSPEPTEAWAHLTTGVSPLLPEGSVDSWTTAYEQHPSRSPLPWTEQTVSHRSSLSSAHDMSSYSRESSVHAFRQIKLEGAADWAADQGTVSPNMQQHQQPLTVSPNRLTTGLYPYETSPYTSPPLPKIEASFGANVNPSAYRSIPRAKPRRTQTKVRGGTARVRVRRNPTTTENAQYKCGVCNMLFQRSYNHKTHMQTHNPERKKEHVCPYKDCGHAFVRKTDLDRHDTSVRCMTIYIRHRADVPLGSSQIESL